MSTCRRELESLVAGLRASGHHVSYELDVEGYISALYWPGMGELAPISFAELARKWLAGAGWVCHNGVTWTQTSMPAKRARGVDGYPYACPCGCVTYMDEWPGVPEGWLEVNGALVCPACLQERK